MALRSFAVRTGVLANLKVVLRLRLALFKDAGRALWYAFIPGEPAKGHAAGIRNVLLELAARLSIQLAFNGMMRDDGFDGIQRKSRGIVQGRGGA